VLINTFARLIKADDYPVGITQERFDANLHMSTDPASDRDTSLVLRNHAPSVAGDPSFRRWWERAGRRGASPATAAALWRVRYGADDRTHLAALTAPALVLHSRGNHVIPMAHGASLAHGLPSARFVEIEGADQTPFMSRLLIFASSTDSGRWRAPVHWSYAAGSQSSVAPTSRPYGVVIPQALRGSGMCQAPILSESRPGPWGVRHLQGPGGGGTPR
jgi:hypothetical protein